MKYTILFFSESVLISVSCHNFIVIVVTSVVRARRFSSFGLVYSGKLYLPCITGMCFDVKLCKMPNVMRHPTASRQGIVLRLSICLSVLSDVVLYLQNRQNIQNSNYKHRQCL